MKMEKALWSLNKFKFYKTKMYLKQKLTIFKNKASL